MALLLVEASRTRGGDSLTIAGRYRTVGATNQPPNGVRLRIGFAPTLRQPSETRGTPLMSTLTPTTPTADSHAAGAMLGKLFDEHGRMVLGVCRIYLHDEYEAEDAAEETFISAHRSVLSGRHPEQAGAWLAAIARNECRDRLRRDVRRNTTSAPAEVFERIPAAHATCVADEIDQGASLQNALSDLPENQREAFVLREMLGLRYDEIAKALGTTQSAVESLLVRARRGLQDHLRPLRLVPVALVVPFALRESVGHAVFGFPVGAASSSTIATGSGTLLASTSGQAGQAGTSAATTSGAGATSASGAAASGGTTGIGIGTGAAATTAASTVAAVASVPALAGVAKMMVVPILAKLAVAGAATTVVATMAVSKPWNVETKRTAATPAAEVSHAASPANPEPGAGPEAALVSEPGAAVGDGSAQGVADGEGAAKSKTLRKGKNKGGGNGAAESDANPIEELSDAQTPSAAVAAATQDAGEAQSPPPAETAESQSSPDSTEPNTNSTAGAAKAGKGKGKKRGHEADGPGASNDAPGRDKKAQGSGGASSPKSPDSSKSLSPSIDTTDGEDEKKNGKGRKRGHEEDGPGNSNESSGKKQGRANDLRQR